MTDDDAREFYYILGRLGQERLHLAYDVRTHAPHDQTLEDDITFDDLYEYVRGLGAAEDVRELIMEVLAAAETFEGEARFAVESTWFRNGDGGWISHGHGELPDLDATINEATLRELVAQGSRLRSRVQAISGSLAEVEWVQAASLEILRNEFQVDQHGAAVPFSQLDASDRAPEDCVG
ncbi:hypothetical protein ACFC1W_01285 [Microbacterium sp. NPDC056003]|uniref:hypothetical protein n=1 Tax=Microbacterium sp. NPDC056003 TaxID=3345676 RepID=UPI0035E27F8B